MNIKKLREEKGVTQKELANYCGIKRNTITMIERGVNRPSVKLAQKIGAFFDVPWYKLYENEDEK